MDTGFTPRLIAFAGPAGSGKSEAASVLVQSGFVRLKFADTLKGMLTVLYEMTDLDREEIWRRLEGDLKEKPDPYLNGSSPRHAMRTLGTEWGRELIHPDIWTSLWRRRVNLHLKAGLSVVVDDLRFPNEADLVRDLGGEIYKVFRPQVAVTSDHPSERFDFGFDGYIANAGSVPDLQDFVRLKFL